MGSTVVCTIYGLLVTLIGIVLTASKHFSNYDFRRKMGIFSWERVYQLVLRIMAIIFYLYLFIYINGFKRRRVKKHSFGKSMKNGMVCHSRAEDAFVYKESSIKKTHIQNGHMKSYDNDAYISHDEGSEISSQPPEYNGGVRHRADAHNNNNNDIWQAEHGDAHHVDYWVYDGAEGVNLYLRFGALVFGFIFLLSDVQLIGQMILWDMSDTYDCLVNEHMILIVEHFVFIAMTIYLIAKCHRLIIHKHKMLVRFGMIHIVSVCLIMYTRSTIAEVEANLYTIQKTFKAKAAKAEKLAAKDAAYAYEKTNYTSAYMTTPYPTTLDVNVSDEHEDDHVGGDYGYGIYPGCTISDTISSSAAPLLFPFFIEFMLIAAAVSYKLYTQVGAEAEEHTPDEEGPAVDECHRATTGLIVGLIVSLLVGFAMSVVFILDYDQKKKYHLIIDRLYLIVRLILIGSSIVAIALCFYKIRQFKQNTKFSMSLDSYLLLLAVLGTYLLNFFLVVALVFITIRGSGNEVVGDSMVNVFIVDNIGEVIEVTMQNILIFKGLNMYADERTVRDEKPGRGLITYLTLINIGQWLLKIFYWTKVDISYVAMEFYDPQLWSILSVLTFPLAVFYRFHAAAVLSELWGHLYHPHHDADAHH